MSPIKSVWTLFASPRTTAALAIAMAGLALVSALVPQGSAAVALARYEHSESIQALYTWGLTDVFGSPWLKVLGALLVGNVIAVVISTRWGSGQRATTDVPDRVPEDTKLEASRPEDAVERLRETFRGVLGAPVGEKVDGPRVTLTFDAGTDARLAPLWAHLGLILLVVGAAWASRPPPLGQQVVRAWLDVKDSKTNKVYTYDLIEGEVAQFFQWRYQYVIRNYAASKAGLGPAVQIERILPDLRQRDDFWIYQYAPPGFDEKHRQGKVSISARKLGLVPAPGAGLSHSGSGVLLLLGLGFLIYGAAAGGQAEGRLWIHIDGRTVRLAGAPRRANDESFSRAFRRWDLLARASLAE